MTVEKHYDVAILGAGLAGLTLCRQLLLNGFNKRILLVDNRADLPGQKQKVGESLVQVAGYYFTRVLDLEEHLLQEHYPKYNLRFYWRTPGKENLNLEDYSRSFIGKSSNVATYHLNRNKVEQYLLETLLESPHVSLCAPVAALKVEPACGGPHTIRFQLEGAAAETKAEWLVDTTGRTQLLKRNLSLRQESPIRHASSWCWVDGLVNVERLTDRSLEEIQRQRDVQKQGLFPIWLATNHFCGEGFWFWVIPLKGFTSLGIVYDSSLISPETFSSGEKLIEWVCREFPLFRRDLPRRKILHSARLQEFSYDSTQTISADKWAISGMSGRFSDPLYSPGSDLIAYYNTLIADAILEPDAEKLKAKTELYEPLMRVFYEAYVPSYCVSYDSLGDQEIFTLKYGWELAIYFSFYTFPFINGLFTNARFIRYFFRKFAQLGPINRNLQKFFSGYYQWKKSRGDAAAPVANDFTELTSLKRAETSYYKAGLSVEQAEEELEHQLRNLKEFARFILAHISSRVLGDKRVLRNRAYVAGIKLSKHTFDPQALEAGYQAHAGCDELYEWSLDLDSMDKFRHAGMREP